MMWRIAILISLFPLIIKAQQTSITNTATLTKIYSQAIHDFIKASNKRNKTIFDTLYIAKRKLGQPDDFPEIELPNKIENTFIKLISPSLGEKLQKDHKSQNYINLIGWVNTENAEFIFVVFSGGMRHQYDYEIHYKLNSTTKKFVLEKSEFREAGNKN